jgi:hypothetical protein
MAYTAGQVIRAALQKILVQASEADLVASEYQDAIISLNAMMADWENSGISLGYTAVSDLADTLTVSDGAIRGIINNLAIEVSPDYDVTPSPLLMAAAADSMKTIRKLGQSLFATEFPVTLPIGSGNDSYLYADRFYNGDEHNDTVTNEDDIVVD